LTSAADFRAALPAHGGRLAGLDVGTKTIGLATLRGFIERHSIVGLVVGLPLNMDGSDSPRTQSVRAFARNLGPLGLPLLLWDERWSTVAVERVMIEADVSRAKRATRVDAHAAAHILQGAIDALVNLAAPG
jgi:putative Holliday junction resolvase